MRKPFYISLLLATLVWQAGGVQAQTQTDGIMMPKGEFCVALMGEKGSWDRYWEGTTLIENGNIGTFSRTMVMPMMAYGISNRIMVLAQLP